jgi:hypothetical protein
MKKLLVVLLVAALMLGWGFGARQVQAGGPPAVDFYIEVATAGCDTDGGSTTCNVPVGTSFTVGATLNSFSNLPVGGNVNGWEVRLTNSASMPYVPRAGVLEMGPPWWPACDLPFEFPGVDTYIGLCSSVVTPPSSYNGLVMEVDYNCTTSPSAGHTITMVHGQPNDTMIADETANFVVDGDPDEVLTINCVEPPLPTPPPPPPVGGIVETLTGGDSPAEGSASSSSDYTLAIAAAAAGAVLALAVGGWYVRRRWLS